MLAHECRDHGRKESDGDAEFGVEVRDRLQLLAEFAYSFVIGELSSLRNGRLLLLNVSHESVPPASKLAWFGRRRLRILGLASVSRVTAGRSRDPSRSYPGAR